MGENRVKHRLTLNGVANRESFISSVIGIAKKHSHRSNQKNVGTEESEKPDDDNKIDSTIRPATMQSTINVEPFVEKSRKSRSLAHRLFTPATASIQENVKNATRYNILDLIITVVI